MFSVRLSSRGAQLPPPLAGVCADACLESGIITLFFFLGLGLGLRLVLVILLHGGARHEQQDDGRADDGRMQREDELEV